MRSAMIEIYRKGYWCALGDYPKEQIDKALAVFEETAKAMPHVSVRFTVDGSPLQIKYGGSGQQLLISDATFKTWLDKHDDITLVREALQAKDIGLAAAYSLIYGLYADLALIMYGLRRAGISSMYLTTLFFGDSSIKSVRKILPQETELLHKLLGLSDNFFASDNGALILSLLKGINTLRCKLAMRALFPGAEEVGRYKELLQEITGVSTWSRLADLSYKLSQEIKNMVADIQDDRPSFAKPERLAQAYMSRIAALTSVREEVRQNNCLFRDGDEVHIERVNDNLRCALFALEDIYWLR